MEKDNKTINDLDLTKIEDTIDSIIPIDSNHPLKNKMVALQNYCHTTIKILDNNKSKINKVKQTATKNNCQSQTIY